MIAHLGNVDRVDAAAVEKVEFGVGAVTAVTEGEAAAVFLREGVARHFAVAGRDHEAVFVVSDGQISVHLLNLRFGQAHFLNGAGIGHAFHGLGAFVVAHRHHALQSAQHRAGIARAEHICQVLHRDAQAFDRRQYTVALRQTTRVRVGLNR